jgi:hypothetical protein
MTPRKSTPEAARRKAGAGLPSSVTITIGNLPVRFSVPDSSFAAMLAERYAPFLRSGKASQAEIEFDVCLVAPGSLPGPQELDVRFQEGMWRLGRGDFRAEFDLAARRGRITLFPNPYAIDALLRIVHSLLMAGSGGILLHAASGISGGRAVVFSGVSGAGKTTIARLAPPSVRLLTDEISYLRREGTEYRVYGTPFSGELGMRGEDISAPLAAIHLIEHGAANRRAPLAQPEAVRRLLRNTLFFAQEAPLVSAVFATLCDLTERVPVYRLEFAPDARVWELAA